jgi:hypothetical protein
MSERDAMTETVWKMIYLARRNPALAPEDYPQAWREHSALGKACPSVGALVKSVAQCARVLDAAPLAGASTDYDGVNLMVMADRASTAAIWDDPEVLAVMRPDEPRVFDRHVREFSLVCREQVLRDAPRSGVVLHGFLRRRADLSGTAFRPAWLSAGPDRLLARGPFALAQRVVCNEVVETPPPGYEFDAILEWWFDSVDEVAHAFGRQGLREQLPAGLASLLDLGGSVFMLTRVTHRRP